MKLVILTVMNYAVSVVHFDNSDSDNINLVTFDGGFVSVGIDTSIMSGISDKWSGIVRFAVTR